MNPFPRIQKTVRTVIRELIGRTGRIYRSMTLWNAPSRDLTKADYAFWDKARRGKATALEISGLLLKPVTSKITAWVLGNPPQIKVENPDGREALNQWWGANHADVLHGFNESLDLADSYLVVNPDLSITVLPPNVVEPVVAEEDYSQLIGWKITEKHPHPSTPGDYQTIVDVYTAEERTRTIYKSGQLVGQQQRYQNLLGRLPIVHIANNTGSNQMFGTPECEAMARLLHEYGEVLEAALAGNKRQGRPTPTLKFDDRDGIEQFFEENSTRRTTTLADGTTETYLEVNFDSDRVMATTADFKYAQPGQFAGDTKILLELLYFIILEHTELPEFVMGTAIASSKASTETQMPVFERFIEKKRNSARAWILELLEIVQGYLLLRGDITAIEDPQIIFESLTGDDGKLTLETLKWAVTEGLIDDETALTLCPITIENVAEVLKKARTETEQRDQKRRDDDLQAILDRAFSTDGDEEDETTPVPTSSNGRQPVPA